MAEMDYIIVLAISILATSFAILSFAAIIGVILSKLNLMLIKRHINKAAQNGDIDKLSNEFIKLSISKLRSQDLERKKIGLLELKYRWQEANDANKKFIIDELIDVLHNENDMKIKKEIILLLYSLIRLDSEF